MEIPLFFFRDHCDHTTGIANLEDEMYAKIMWKNIENHCPLTQRQHDSEVAERRVRAVGEGLVFLQKQQQ